MTTTIEWTFLACTDTITTMGSRLGVMKIAAKRAGVSLDEYNSQLNMGNKWCRSCRIFEPRENFGVDRSRGDGLASECRGIRATHTPRKYTMDNPAPGQRRATIRDWDASQARHRVSYLVECGRIPPASDLACTDCGDTDGMSRHEYDHYLGYGSAHHEHVEPVCSACHSAREVKRRGGRSSWKDAPGGLSAYKEIAGREFPDV